MSFFDLTPEQQFSLEATRRELSSASREKLERLTVSAITLMRRKKNIIKKWSPGAPLVDVLSAAGLLDGDTED